MKASEFILSEGGGYIPKNAEEARDPRWMMAITNDIKPGETQRQAAKMGFKTDKEGRPPLLKANGKLSENVVWMNDEMPCPACEGGENPPHSNHCPWCNNTGKTTKRTAKYYEVMSGKTKREGLEEARLFLGETGELSNLESMGLFVIDTADLPGYKVFLLGANDDPNWKELAFQQIGQDCTDIAQQLIKIPPKFLPHHALCNIIQKWYEKYGKIYVMSHNPKYLRVYVHMLQRVGFDVKNPLS